jgi:hypothetical protein
MSTKSSHAIFTLFDPESAPTVKFTEELVQFRRNAPRESSVSTLVSATQPSAMSSWPQTNYAFQPACLLSSILLSIVAHFPRNGFDFDGSKQR